MQTPWHQMGPAVALALACVAAAPSTAAGGEAIKLTATDAKADALFGSSVAISGNLAIAGAPGDDHAGASSGSAYLFNANTGQQLFKLTTSDAAANQHFAEPVAISGNRRRHARAI